MENPVNSGLMFTELVTGDRFWEAHNIRGHPATKTGYRSYEYGGYQFQFYPGKDRDPKEVPVVRAVMVDGPGGMSKSWAVEPETVYHETRIFHSGASRDRAIQEGQRLGDPSEGDGWRRLLWRMADLLEKGYSQDNPGRPLDNQS